MDMLAGMLDAIKPRRDGDIADRVNYCYTTCLVTVFALFIVGWEFCGTTIECWFPAYFSPWWSQYGLDYCYIQNTYFIPLAPGPRDNLFETAPAISHIPKNLTERMDKTIPYYQWLPFILTASSLSFYAPIVVWRAGNSSFGLWVNTILVSVHEASSQAADEREKSMEKMSRYISVCLDAGRNLSHRKASRNLRTSNIALLYLFVKFLFVLNAVLHFVTLTACLGFSNYRWGFDILVDMSLGKPWQESHYFPRVTLCDFEVRTLGNLHRHTVQCVLMINMFAEKMFIFLWWWLIMVSVITILSFLYWLYVVISMSTNFYFVQQFYYKMAEDEFPKCGDDEIDGLYAKRELDQFMRTALHRDGIFLLKMVSVTSGDLVTLLLLKNLWKQYKKKKRKRYMKFEVGKAKKRKMGKLLPSSSGSSPTYPPFPSAPPSEDMESQQLFVPQPVPKPGLWEKEVKPGSLIKPPSSTSASEDEQRQESEQRSPPVRAELKSSSCQPKPRGRSASEFSALRYRR